MKSRLRNLWLHGDASLRFRVPLLRRINRRSAQRNLVDITRALDSHGIRHWLSDGTLLGLVREGNLIRRDADTDVGVEASTFNPDVLPDLVALGFTIKRMWGTPESGCELNLVRDYVKTDLFFFYGAAEGTYHSAYVEEAPGSAFAERIDYSYERFGVARVKFALGTFWCPDDYHRYLETKYGVGWHTPVSDWDYARDPSNAVPSGFRVSVPPQDPSVAELIRAFRSIKPGCSLDPHV